MAGDGGHRTMSFRDIALAFLVVAVFGINFVVIKAVAA